MKAFEGIFVLLVLLSVTGCTTFSNTKTQEIEIRTSGVDNVNCYVGNDTFKYEFIAPGKIAIERTSEDYDIICSKAGYYDTHEKIKSNDLIGKAVIGNIYNGVLPGLLYDTLSNSAYEFPDMLIVSMERNPNRYIVPREEKYVLPKKDYDLIASIKTSSVLPLNEDDQDAVNAIFNGIIK